MTNPSELHRSRVARAGSEGLGMACTTLSKKQKNVPFAASSEISHATKTGRDTRGASPFGSQKKRVGDPESP